MQIKKLNSRAVVPSKKVGNAGFDIAVQVLPEELLELDACKRGYKLFPNERKTFGTGLAVWLQDPRLELQLRSRSKLGTQKGIIVTQGIGTIDSTYQGELMVSLHNISEEPFVIEDGMLVAQGILSPVTPTTSNSEELKQLLWWLKQPLPVWFTEVEEFTEGTERGVTGINCEDLRLFEQEEALRALQDSKDNFINEVVK